MCNGSWNSAQVIWIHGNSCRVDIDLQDKIEPLEESIREKEHAQLRA